MSHCSSTWGWARSHWASTWGWVRSHCVCLVMSNVILHSHEDEPCLIVPIWWWAISHCAPPTPDAGRWLIVHLPDEEPCVIVHPSDDKPCLIVSAWWWTVSHCASTWWRARSHCASAWGLAMSHSVCLIMSCLILPS